jgi:hypothetical protein
MSKKLTEVPPAEALRLASILDRVQWHINSGRKLTERGQQYAAHLEKAKKQAEAIVCAYQDGL